MKSSGEDSRTSSTTTTKVLENSDEIVKQVIHLAELQWAIDCLSEWRYGIDLQQFF